jgi:hypothetical protein
MFMDDEKMPGAMPADDGAAPAAPTEDTEEM